MDRAGFAMPPELATRERSGGNLEHEGARRQLVAVYRTRPDLAQVCERLVDLDEGLQEWRYRHVKMVERTIGMKSGTGGSSGAEYLRATLFRPLFPDLWAIRNEF
jgi:tryptophan 2,3-dioxygenase